MTGFTIGMIAAALWLGVAVSIWFFVRSSPGEPARSVRSFRVARRRLSAIDTPPATPIEPEPEPEPAPTEEIEEIERVIESVTSEAPIRPAPRKPTNRPPHRPRGPRKMGRLTYVLVDEMGRPEL